MRRPALCLCLSQARTPDIVLVAAAAGFDAVYVDLEHGVTPLDTTSMLCTTARGVGLLPMVRVPSLDPPLITRVLDGGARGIIVPHVRSAEEARAVVEICRFPPLGRRTAYVTTPATGYRSEPASELAAELDADVVVVPMVESADAVEAAKDIAAVDGVDIVLVGVHDLSADLGVPGQLDAPVVGDALLAVADACSAGGADLGVAGLTDPTLLRTLADRGLALVTAGTDVGLLAAAATARATELRGLLATDKDGSR